jgi:hypothetical protein
VRRCSSRGAVAASIVVLAVAGCGGSAKKSSSTHNTGTHTSTATSSTSSTGTTSTTSSHPLTKAQYEARLSPLLNRRIAPALRSALSNGGARNPQKLSTAANLLKEAQHAMSSLTPPTQVASLNHQAVVILGALANDLSNMSSSVRSHNTSGYQSAARSAVRDALNIQHVGNQFTAHGF